MSRENLTKLKRVVKKIIAKPPMSPYDAGFDCGKNGANMTNCDFRYFGTEANMKEWSRGKKDGEKR